MDVTDKLILEITERGIPDQLAIDTLWSTKGLHIAVDDFGTGDLNLIDLSRLNINIIKIDKVFIDQIQTREFIPKMVRGLTAMAREFEAMVIAEGVETEIQVNTLKEIGVDMAQGWYYSKSLSRDAFLDYYQKHQ
jgi:sensor c-di-GMP phosphodiesterase-like protein